jgi:hypothetical protein
MGTAIASWRARPPISVALLQSSYERGVQAAEAGDSDVVDSAFNWSIFRLLTPKLEIGVESGWTNRNWGVARRSGFDVTSFDLKGEVYRNDLHEILISAGTTWGIEHTGAQGIGGNAPNLIAPGIFFGKGFGDLPDNLAWLRPFAITGAVSFEQPLAGGTSTNVGLDAQTGQVGPLLTRNVEVVHWGLAIEFSTLYLMRLFGSSLIIRLATIICGLASAPSWAQDWTAFKDSLAARGITPR